MIKVSVLYPRTGASFDMNYYVTKHMPMARQKFGAACKGMAIEQGVAGGVPGTPPAFVAMGHFLFDDADAFRRAFAPHAKEIMGDIPNYTSIEPVIQISEVKV